MNKKFFLLFILFLWGCRTPSGHRSGQAKILESQKDVRTAIESVAGAVTQKNVKINYCPTCGRRFSPNQTTCPYDGSKLRALEDE